MGNNTNQLIKVNAQSRTLTDRQLIQYGMQALAGAAIQRTSDNYGVSMRDTVAVMARPAMPPVSGIEMIQATIIDCFAEFDIVLREEGFCQYDGYMAFGFGTPDNMYSDNNVRVIAPIKDQLQSAFRKIVSTRITRNSVTIYVND